MERTPFSGAAACDPKRVHGILLLTTRAVTLAQGHRVLRIYRLSQVGGAKGFLMTSGRCLSTAVICGVLYAIFKLPWLLYLTLGYMASVQALFWALTWPQSPTAQVDGTERTQAQQAEPIPAMRPAGHSGV